MPDYQKAKIYRIINDNMPGKVYYGSTCQKLGARMASHRRDAITQNNSSKELFQTGKPIIVLIENFPCNSKEELHKRERFYIENNSCVNKEIPGRTGAEYYQDNKEKFRKYYQEYRENNKEKMKEMNKKYQRDNIEIIKKKDALKYQKNKKKILERSATKITCECGKTVRNGSLTKHKKSARHIKLMKPV